MRSSFSVKALTLLAGRIPKKNAAPSRRARACPSPGYSGTRAIAGETRSHARVACEGPRATVDEAGAHHLCRAGSPDPDPFVNGWHTCQTFRRSQTTAGKTHIVTMALAGDRPPHYDKKNGSVGWHVCYRHVGPKGPKTPPLEDAQRGGQAPALR